jgi:chemosensory pili system protein ChpA (sensor histidine kinase/response regulator)
MRLQDDLDFTTLNWVKQELDETLRQAQQALEAYVEDPADSSLMRFCATYLHQVQGTLRMVELYGAAMVVEEMERVANALLDGQIRQKDDTYGVLMRGIVQLPDYLERLQSGHKDIPIVLLPLLNDLRACRGEKLLSESVLFSPDLAAPLPRSAAGPERPVPELELKALSNRLRTNFQTGLLHWFRNTSPSEAIGGLVGTLERLRAITTQDEARRLWWVAAGVLDAVMAGGIEASAALKVLFGRVDREIKRLADAGEASFRVDPPRELTKNLLYYVAHAKGETERVRDVRRTYRLDQLLPSAQELEHAKGSLAGKNRALLDTVSAAIKEDLMRVKDALDMHLRTQDAKPADLAAQTEVLDRVADTLGMLGLGVPRRVVQEQRSALTEIASGARKADEGALLDVAGALLYVEASLDDNIESLGAAEPAAAAPAATAPELELPHAEVRRILDALMKEASVNLGQAKQDIVAFVESPWDHAKVEQIPRLLEEIAGAMRMLDLQEPAQLLHAMIRFVEVELIRFKRVPTPEQMDRLADALASIEYYLEAARDQRAGRERILDVTRRSLESLGYWPIPEAAVETELDELAGLALEQAAPPREPAPAPAPRVTAAPTPAPTPSPVDFSGLEVDVGGLSFTTPTQAGADSLQPETEGLAATEDMPSVDLPSESLDEFIARMERGEQAPTGAPAGAAPPAEPTPELLTAVDIAPGHDIADLIVGEGAQGAVSPPPAHEVTGLKFAETERLTSAAAPMPAEEVEYDWVEIEEEVEVDAAAEAVSDASFVAVPSDDIDDEIREVFVEEVQEEIENVGRQLPMWKQDLHDLEKLKPIRRSFHTLKGSGRLVGAMALGEFSWKIENMLNRVLDKTITASPAVLALLDHAMAALPQMLSALRGEGPPRADIGGIMGVAEKLASGEEAWVKAPVKTKVKQTRRVRVARPKPAPPPPVELTQTLDITRPLTPEPEPVVLESPMLAEAADVPPANEALTPIEVLSEPAAPAPMPVEPAAAERPEEAPSDVVEALEADFLAALETTEPRAAAPAEGAISMPALDPMLLEILRSEVEGHLASLRDYLRESVAAGTPQPATETVLRAVHTMHGAVSMADVPAINAIVGPLEGYVKRLRASGQPPSEHGFATLRAAADLIEDVLRLLDKPGAPLPDPRSLAADLDALRDLLPEPETAFSVFDLALEDEEPLPVPAAPRAAPAAAIEPPELGESVPEPDLLSMEPGSISLDDLTLAASFEEPAPVAPAEEPVAEELAAEEPAVEEPILDIEPARERGEVLPPLEELAELDEAAFALEEPVAPAELLRDEAPSIEPAIAEPVERRVVEQVAAAAEPAGAEEPSGLAPIAEDPDPEGPLVLPDMDEDLVAIFVEEGTDILDKADALVARLRESPTEQEAITGLQRHLHTLKGNARAVGLTGVGDLSHAMESLIEQAAGERATLSRIAVESLERGFDKLHRMVSRVGRRQAVGIPHHAIARFEALVAGETIETVPAAPAVPAARDVAPEPVPAETAPKPAPVPAPAAPTPAPAKPKPVPAARPLPEPVDEEAIPRAPQEMIRVRSELLDALVNFAGEVSIYRSRLEQQIGTFRFNLVELDQTVARLREQLRKLEMETEAQIIARYQREADAAGEHSFDPLELDRFSTLQQLSRALAESVSDLAALQNLLDDLTRQAETLLLQQSRVSSELQEGLMRTRMVPFDSVVPFLRRLIRQTADELGKRAALRVEGAQGEMDRNLLERMKAPFEHMLRNAMAHGIEQPGERAAAGKPEEGQVKISVSREATEVVIKVSDDGKGMDRDAIKRKAIERGLMRPDAQLSDRDLFGFVLETGFSTVEQVTKIAGRGVGMDVVASEIKQLGGSLSIDSQRGRGTEFTIRLPFTLAVTQAIQVRMGDQIFAVPMSSVQGVARIARDDFDRRITQPHPTFSYAGEDYVIHELNNLLGISSHRASDDAQLPLLLARTGDQRAAVRIDAVMGSREIVVKSVGPQVSSVPGIFGATIMGDGSVVMILDLAPLVRRSAALREEIQVEAALEEALPGLVAPAMPAAAAPEVRRQPVIMVVDDSITMRKVTSRVLERHDMEVVTAKDGLDAVEKLQDRIPDLVLLDIEMPRMDGYELATYMRNDPRLKTVPIIMITSRTGEKHRQRAFEIGVDRYLGKPYQEADLLRNVEETLRLSRAMH